ncbi:DUF1176 domain-containing protein [Pigmentiphaga aceris]|nr:DUF1176 domain-containing protein [Pigmentiphaga aceris]
MHRLRALLLTTALASPALALAQDIDPYYAEYKDWTLTCDNLGRCEASALVDGSKAALRLVREAGPSTPTLIKLSSAGELRVEDFRVDGQETPLSEAIDWGHPTSRKGGSQFVLDGQYGQYVVDALRNASQLSLGPRAGDATISLAGMTAALLSMDAQQRRLDTEGALIRKGPLPEARATAPRTMPRVPTWPLSTKPVEAGLLSATQAARGEWVNGACAGKRPTDPRDRAHPLTDTHVLVLLECQRSGDRSWFMGFKVDRTQRSEPEMATTTTPPGAWSLSAPGWASPELDPTTGTLRFDAPADADRRCGYRVTQRFDGNAFSLVDYREQKRCAGLPDDWPVWYRSTPEPISAAQ